MADHKDKPPPPPPHPHPHPHSFFKVFIGVDGPSPAHPFVVPPSYVKAVGGALPDKYTLQGPDGDLTLVQVKKNGFHWFFRGGWGPFIKDYSLKFGDFLFFTLDHISTAAAAAATTTTTQKLHFQVYGINGYLKMMGNSTSAHSFYKIFTGQAQDNFRVPPPYVNAIGGVLLDKYMLRGPNGEYRIVEVERDGGFWFFKGGWGGLGQKYPLSLNYGDILVFTMHSKVELHFQAYERNGCVKKLSNCCGDEKGKQVKGQKKGTNSFGWVSARLVEELDSIRCDPKYGTLLDLYLGYGAYEDEGLEEASMNGISSGAADSQYDTCNESNDEEVVVSCKRANTTTPVLDDESKPVLNPGPSLRKVDLKDASLKIPYNMHGDSLNPVRSPNYRRQSPRKNSTKPTLNPKNEVHMDEEIQDRSNVKREESVNVKVVARRHPSSMIYTMQRCSPERRDKLIRSAQRLKLGRPLAGLILTRSCTINGVLHLPKPFFQSHFSIKQLKAMVRESGRLITSANGNYWPVEFVFHIGRVSMTNGWSVFVHQHNLREGDLCFFQFIKTEPVIELRISISHPRKS